MLHFLIALILVTAFPTNAFAKVIAVSKIRVDSEKIRKTICYRLEEQERATTPAIKIIGRAITIRDSNTKKINIDI